MQMAFWIIMMLPEYDTNGKVIRRYSWFVLNSIIETYHTYEYDSYSNIIKESLYDANSALKNYKTYEYKNDINW